MGLRRGILIGVIIASALFFFVFIFRTLDYHDEILRLNREAISLEERMSIKAGNWVEYLESRVNRVAQSQDEYQWSTSKRVDYLTDKIIKLEKRITDLDKRINQKEKQEVSEK